MVSFLFYIHVWNRQCYYLFTNIRYYLLNNVRYYLLNNIRYYFSKETGQSQTFLHIRKDRQQKNTKIKYMVENNSFYTYTFWSRFLFMKTESQ